MSSATKARRDASLAEAYSGCGIVDSTAIPVMLCCTDTRADSVYSDSVLELADTGVKL